MKTDFKHQEAAAGEHPLVGAVALLQTEEEAAERHWHTAE